MEIENQEYPGLVETPEEYRAARIEYKVGDQALAWAWAIPVSNVNSTDWDIYLCEEICESAQLPNRHNGFLMTRSQYDVRKWVQFLGQMVEAWLVRA